MADPFHIFLVIIGLSGQPVDIIRSNVPYETKELCEEAIPADLVAVQKAFDEAENPNIRGKLAVADAKCLTDKEAGVKVPDSI